MRGRGYPHSPLHLTLTLAFYCTILINFSAFSKKCFKILLPKHFESVQQLLLLVSLRLPLSNTATPEKEEKKEKKITQEIISLGKLNRENCDLVD